MEEKLIVQVPQNLLVSPRLFVIGSPPANIPATMISFEKATWSWTEKYPPDEKPDTEIKFLLTRYDSMPEHEEEREKEQDHLLVITPMFKSLIMGYT